jgi:hypothetical protein
MLSCVCVYVYVCVCVCVKVCVKVCECINAQRQLKVLCGVLACICALMRLISQTLKLGFFRV